MPETCAVPFGHPIATRSYCAKAGKGNHGRNLKVFLQEITYLQFFRLNKQLQSNAGIVRDVFSIHEKQNSVVLQTETRVAFRSIISLRSGSWDHVWFTNLPALYHSFNTYFLVHYRHWLIFAQNLSLNHQTGRGVTIIFSICIESLWLSGGALVCGIRRSEV